MSSKPPRSRSALRRVRVALAALLVASMAATSFAAVPATAAEKPFRLNLYREGDFVSQTNLVQCVGTSMQMMINMMGSKDDRSSAWQLELQRLARRYSPRHYNGTELNGQVRERRGASVRGWAFGLSKLGYGPYRVTAGGSVEEAIRMAAVAMQRTGRPVGLLMWRGRHAWVMSGFEATGDPLMDPEAEITHVYIQDPLYPRTSSAWGPSPAPNTKLTLARLGKEFLPRRWRSNLDEGDRYTIVLPYPELRPFARFSLNIL